MVYVQMFQYFYTKYREISPEITEMKTQWKHVYVNIQILLPETKKHSTQINNYHQLGPVAFT